MEPTPRSSDPQHLPAGLTATVRVVEEILGRVVADAEGEALYAVVESVRREMVTFREARSEPEREESLDRAAERLGALSVEERIAVARAFTLYLQLVNVCENAYRTHRLCAPHRGPADHADAPPDGARAQVTFVLTAHPTESRSPENIRLLRRVQDAVGEALECGRPIDRRQVRSLLHLAWRVGTHPARKPSVADEANHLFSLLTDPILDEVVTLTEAGHQVLFRTWVGGDKDGHPGVGPAQTQEALACARERLLAYARGALLIPARDDVALLADAEPALSAALGRLEEALGALAVLADGDGARVAGLCAALDDARAAYLNALGVGHPALERLATLLSIFPALVVPLELREERGRFADADPIADMMRRVAAIAVGGPIDAYARAIVVSMTLEARDLLEAQERAAAVFGGDEIPVIPLFELPDVLERAPAILAETWTHERFRNAVRDRGHLEVMLGYSDTAKRMGMLGSRVAIHDAMRRISAWADSEGVVPLFFHGHGGSVGRGGGRIEDLMATWPPEARTPYKYTLQGEMVERTLATREILRSLVEKVAAVQHDPPPYSGVGSFLGRLAEASGNEFATHVASEAFRRLLARATPYTRLQALTIGSRPSRRSGGGLEELRAIPWVLCWTQTRLLLHAWMGAGHAWRALSGEPGVDEALARARRCDALFRSYARLLSFTMAKTAPTLWRRYRRRLAPDADPELVAQLDADFDAAVDLARRALGHGGPLPERPWLEESIRYRAPMIHPLNLLQIELLERSEWTDEEVRLFRETVTGIAAGMLTTG